MFNDHDFTRLLVEERVKELRRYRRLSRGGRPGCRERSRSARRGFRRA